MHVQRMAVVSVLAVLMIGSAAMAVNVDGIITSGEWTGAATYTIGNGGGTAYLKADTNFIYGAFDITGWTSAMGATSGGNLLGFGVWKANNSYGPAGTGVEFQQSTTAAAWGVGSSGTMNGLVSAFRINTVIQGSIPGSLQAMDSFATGHRVWEVKIPIATMGVSAGDDIYVVGGINYNKDTHWYPNTFPLTYTGYAPVSVGAAPVPEPLTMTAAFLAIGGLGSYLRKRSRVA